MIMSTYGLITPLSWLFASSESNFTIPDYHDDFIGLLTHLLHGLSVIYHARLYCIAICIHLRRLVW